LHCSRPPGALTRVFALKEAAGDFRPAPMIRAIDPAPLPGPLLPAVPQPVEQAEALGYGGWEPAAHHLSKAELWAVMRQEARAAAEKEPVLASFLHMTVIMHASLEKSMAFLLANKLSSPTLLGTQLTRLFMEAYEVGAAGLRGVCGGLRGNGQGVTGVAYQCGQCVGQLNPSAHSLQNKRSQWRLMK
jgi:hypothetical protein